MCFVQRARDQLKTWPARVICRPTLAGCAIVAVRGIRSWMTHYEMICLGAVDAVEAWLNSPSDGTREHAYRAVYRLSRMLRWLDGKRVYDAQTDRWEYPLYSGPNRHWLSERAHIAALAIVAATQSSHSSASAEGQAAYSRLREGLIFVGGIPLAWEKDTPGDEAHTVAVTSGEAPDPRLRAIARETKVRVSVSVVDVDHAVIISK